MAFCFAERVLVHDAQQTNTPNVNAFSAKQAVDYALKNAVQVKNALIDIEMQKQVNKEITAAALPQITGSGSLNYNPNVAVQTFPNFIAQGTYGVLIANNVKDGNGNPITAPKDYGLINAAFGAKYALSGGIDLNQILFDGQVFVGLQARKETIHNAELAAEVTKEQIKANVYKIYYQLVVGQRQIGTITANIDNYEKLLHDTKEIYKNGFAEKLDVDKVQVQLNNLNTQKLKAQNQIDAGLAGLKFLMNMPQKDSLVLTDTLSDEELKSGILDEEYNYENKKEYQQLESTIKLGEYNVRRYKLSKLPTLSLSANYSQSAQRQQFDFFKGPYFTSSFIALRLNVPIFEGGANNAKIAEAKLSLLKYNNSLDQLKSSIDNDVTQSRINMKSALITMDSQKKNTELAQNVYNTTKLKYDQGLGSNQEINTAQTDLITAQNNYYSSLYDAIIAKIDYLAGSRKTLNLKLNYYINSNTMQKITTLSLMIIFMAVASSCGDTSKKEGSLSDKKASLEKLKKDKSDLDDKIAALEKDIAKLDTSATKPQDAKLVAITPVTLQDFKHYLDLQGVVDSRSISYITPSNQGGQIKAILVKQGDYVHKGQLDFEIG